MTILKNGKGHIPDKTEDMPLLLPKLNYLPSAYGAAVPVAPLGILKFNTTLVASPVIVTVAG